MAPGFVNTHLRKFPQVTCRTLRKQLPVRIGKGLTRSDSPGIMRPLGGAGGGVLVKLLALLLLAPTFCLAQYFPTTYNVNVRYPGQLPAIPNYMPAAPAAADYSGILAIAAARNAAQAQRANELAAQENQERERRRLESELETAALQREALRRQMARDEAASARNDSRPDPRYGSGYAEKVITNARDESGLFHRAGCTLVTKGSYEVFRTSAETAHLKPCSACAEGANVAPIQAALPKVAKSKKNKMVYVDLHEEDPVFHRAGCKAMSKSAAMINIRVAVEHAKPCEECY